MAAAFPSTADRSSISYGESVADRSLPGGDPRQQLLISISMEKFEEASDLIYGILDDDKDTVAKERKELEMAREGVGMLLNEILDPKTVLNNLLHLAAAMGDDMTCGYIFHHQKPNVNAELFGATPLHYALNSVNPDPTVKLLLDNHADPNKPDSTGRTPMVIASYKGLNNCIGYLIERGADPNEIAHIEDVHSNTDLQNDSQQSTELLRTVQEHQHNENNSNGPRSVRQQEEDNQQNGNNNSGSGTVNLDAKEREKKEQQHFLFGNMDKLPSTFLSVALIAMAASHMQKTDGKHVVQLSESSFQVVCIGIILSIHTNILSFAFTAFYKETEDINSLGFKVLSYVVLVQNLIFIVLVSVVLIGLERANPLYICLAAGVVAAIFIIFWPFPKEPPKSIIDCLKFHIDKRRARTRVEGLPITDP